MSDEFASSTLVLSSERSPTRVSDFHESQREMRDEPPPTTDTPSVTSERSARYHGTSAKMTRLEPSDGADIASLESSIHSMEHAAGSHRAMLQNPQENEETMASSLPQLKEENILEVEALKSSASRLASRGKEEEAIVAYHRALRLLREDMSMLKRGLKEYKDSDVRRNLRHSWIKTAASLAEMRTIMAVLYERLGEYGKAIKASEEAREVYQSFTRMDMKHGTEITQEAHENVEQMDFMIDQLRGAQNSFEERRQLHEKVIETRYRMAYSTRKERKEEMYTDIFSALNKVIRMERESLGETHPQVAETVQIYARLYQERGSIDHSVQQFKSSLDILRLALGPVHPRTALAARELAKLYETRRRGKKDVDSAVHYYKEALKGFRESHGAHHRLVGATANNIAVLYIQENDIDEAIELLSQALAAFEGSDGEKSEKTSTNLDISQVWKNLGECYARKREWENTHFAYMCTLEIQRDARREAEQAKTLPLPKGCDDASLADTLLRLGKATKETVRYEDANMIYREALLIVRVQYKAAKRSKGPPGQRLADAQDRLAHCLYCKAEVQEIRGKYDEAHKMYSEAFQLRLSSDALRDQNRVNMVHCAMALVGIGSVHMRRKETEDACMVYKEALTYLSRHGVPDDHEIVQMIKTKLAQAERGVLASSSWSDESTEADRTLAMDVRCQEHVEAGEFDEALASLGSALGIRRRRLTKRQQKDDEDSYMFEKDEVARTLSEKARILVKKDETKQAIMLYKEAIRMYKSNGFNDTHPCVHDLAVELEQVPV